MSHEKVLRITEEEKKAIKKTYDRSEKEIDEDIKALKEWLEKQPHLPQNEEEIRLRMMLVYNKFSLEKTKNKLDMYYSLKHLVPEFYSDREPQNPQIFKMMETMTCMPLPNLTPDLYRIYFVKFAETDAVKFDLNIYLKFIFGTFDLRIVADQCVGDCFIMDMKHVTVGMALQFTPSIVKKSFETLRKSYSDKIKGIYILNLPSYANTLVTLLNSVLSEKLANRVHVCKDLKSLHAFFSPNILPNEYGGSAGPEDQLLDEWKMYYRSKNDWLKELGEKKSDESKRVGEPLNSDLFGMCGTFRKLNVD